MDMIVGGYLQMKQNKITLRTFRSDYEQPKRYSPKNIVALRKKLNMSQPVFAIACNTNYDTLQKWEQGLRRPTKPIHRLFQLIEKGALKLI